ncbi:TetR/AcrR family transcriptional regulator [Paeniglutamicibacter kerguelensis]|uniref:AcrR family transcriptional regulator n=1 Tax=Paeniglutamicibacter kerguelensis TaxID=254788 RepID=A0ABS4XH59_9MICC|nr:TetR family transcriptional regulator [Paeniglutamicibacter kerguelensis]MBP2387814.1 AcrR family transcriptional regulator [Paeniglutamicibacter kerguelensis]
MLTQEGKREKILTAYLNLLVHQGIRAATLDAVGSACQLSKAGVLHHFSSMGALRQAIFVELQAQAAADANKMLEDLPNAANYYLVSSLSRDSLLERLIEAVNRLAQTGDEAALELLRTCRTGWYEALLLALGDAALAKLVLFAGDGINHNALLSLDETNETFLGSSTANDLLGLVERLRETAGPRA